MNWSTRSIVIVAFSVTCAALAGAWLVWRSKDKESSAIESQEGNPALQAQVKVGAEVYARHCSSCHGRSLEGQPNWKKHLADGSLPAPPFDETGHTWHHPDSVLFATVKLGGQATGPPDFPSKMPAFSGDLSDDEIRAVLAFIKSRWPPEIRRLQEEINQHGSARVMP
ncbi:MAG TPA: cytochrome c [Myxococcota bacterium]|nr:cytochrome c [Myxococcota bacterium]